MPAAPKNNEWLPAYNHAKRLEIKACIVSRCGYVWSFTPAWGNSNQSEVLGYRWLEFVEPDEVPRVLLWIEADDYGPIVFDGVEFGTAAPCRIALVKFPFSDVLFCVGDRELI